MTSPLQGNYGASEAVWESENIWIEGVICQEMQEEQEPASWLQVLSKRNVPVLNQVDTRSLTLRLRDKGSVFGALVPKSSASKSEAKKLIAQARKQDKDWTLKVCTKDMQEHKGQRARGPKVAMIDFGYKKNILRELLKRCSQVRVYPPYAKLAEIKKFKPDGILLSNGPGDPRDVQGVELVKQLLNWKFILGICMGHQVLAQALGAKNYKLKFGHRGSNHPIEDKLTKQIYMSAQNHGYVVDEKSLPSDIEVTHRNLNDQTVAGIFSKKRKFLGVQFHPENSPGPRESVSIFDTFMKKIQECP